MKVEGQFNIESYSISHKKLTIRHSQHFKVKKNVEIIFSGVFFIQLPNYLVDFEIYEGTEQDKRYIESQMKGTQIIWGQEKVFIIKSMDNNYLVGASAFLLKESKNLNEESLTTNEYKGLKQEDIDKFINDLKQ